ncbi:MAG: hypothetical protein Salg2KO_07780 [Salibacteraceae bacterium]
MHNIIATIALTFLSISFMAQDAVKEYKQIDQSEKTLEELQKELAKNPESEEANYNMAIYYYNQGVALIENMDYSADKDVLIKKQEEVMQLFETAMPYAEMAHEMNPREMKTINMLSGLCFGLNDMEKKDYYEAKLAEQQ